MNTSDWYTKLNMTVWSYPTWSINYRSLITNSVTHFIFNLNWLCSLMADYQNETAKFGIVFHNAGVSFCDLSVFVLLLKGYVLPIL